MKNENKVPVKSYYNITNKKISIINENKNKSGVYRWVNIINNKSYVGSSVKIDRRIICYFSFNNIKRIVSKERSMIYSGIIKYGYSKFKLDILEYCPKEILLEREQFYIDILKPEYNILKIAGSRLGIKHSFNGKKAMSIKSRGRKFLYKDKVIRTYLPKVVTSNTKLKLALRSQGVNVKILDSSNNLINEFSTIKSAAKYMGVDYNTISKIYERGISYDEFIYKFNPQDIRIWVYNYENKFIEILENGKKVSAQYNIPKSTLSNYVKSGKLYKKSFYFYNSESKPDTGY